MPQQKGNARGIPAPDKEIILYFAALSQAAGVESFEESAGVLSDDLISSNMRSSWPQMLKRKHF